jgi:hypothetical protein
MADVFISYAREDRDSAKRLVDAIESRGWTVWWDRRIPAGKSYEDVIQQAIDDAGCVIVLWTGKSVASEWVRNEAAEAARRKVLIPIRLEDVRLPLSVRHLEADDLLAWTSAELENCLDSIQSMIGAPAKRASEPPATVDVATVPVVAAIGPVEIEPVPPSVAPAAAPPPTTSGCQMGVWKWVAIALGLLVMTYIILIVIGIFSKQGENVNTGTAPVDTSATTATDTSATTATKTMGTTPVSFFTTDTTSTSATTTGTVAVAGEVVDLDTTMGKITVELFPEAAPNHVSTFLRIARSGGFNGALVAYVDKLGIAAGHWSDKYVQQEPNDLAPARATLMGIDRPNGADSDSQFYVALRDLVVDRKRTRSLAA